MNTIHITVEPDHVNMLSQENKDLLNVLFAGHQQKCKLLVITPTMRINYFMIAQCVLEPKSYIHHI